MSENTFPSKCYKHTIEFLKQVVPNTDAIAVHADTYNVITTFEIFKHLRSPFHVVKDIKGTKIVASIPLRLWLSPAYRSKTDPWDRHSHEFEDWQFDWIFEKAGWEIKKREKFTKLVKKRGIRPILRLFTSHYYLTYIEKKS